MSIHQAKRFLNRRVQGAKNFGKGLGKEFEGDEWIKKDTSGHHINNLFTGRTLGGKGKRWAAGTSLVGGGFYAAYASGENRRQSVEQQQQMQDVMALPGTQGDMQGYSAYPGSDLQNIEVGGDLVFALNKIRHGG